MFSPFLLFEFLKNLFKCSVSSGIWGSPSWARRCSSKVRTPPLYDTHSGWRPIVNLRADPVNSVINLGAHKYLLCVAIDCSQRSAISSYSWYEEESPSHIGTPSFDFSTWRCRSAIALLTAPQRPTAFPWISGSIARQWQAPLPWKRMTCSGRYGTSGANT